MKKNIIAMAVAAAVAAPAAAIADTTLYGNFHVSTDFYGGDNKSSHNYTLSSNQSRIGIRGSEDISTNLAVVYQWETALNVGTDGTFGNDNNFSQRNTFVGLTGDWGTAIAGRHDTPFKQVSRKYELFGDTVGDNRPVTRGSDQGADWDLRPSNVIAYVSPDMSGFQGKVAYVTDWGPEVGEDASNNNYDAWSLSAGYSIAGFSIDAAYEQHNIDGGDQDGWRVGAGYEFDGFKVVALYQDTDMDFDGNSREAWGLGGAYNFGASTVKAQYYSAGSVDNTSSTGADIWALGYDYSLSRQTSVYAVFAYLSNDDNNMASIGAGSGHGQTAPIRGAGDDISSVSFGIRHSF